MAQCVSINVTKEKEKKCPSFFKKWSDEKQQCTYDTEKLALVGVGGLALFMVVSKVGEKRGGR